MTKYEIIIRDSKNNEIIKQEIPDSCAISVIKVESTEELQGWNKREVLWSNKSFDEKKRLLEQSTF